ncbi:hypothetical protein RFI_35274, partial [Reticulomyxa filosa]
IFSDSSFLSSQLRTCHKSLIDSFKSWIISWIHFDKDKHYAYEDNRRIIDRPLNKVMLLHLPKFQHLLHHPDIHCCLCISTETSDVVVQYYKQVFKTHPEMCTYLLCVISVKLNEQQLDDVIELFMDGLVDKNQSIHYRYAKSIAKIALKLNEKQLNE